MPFTSSKESTLTFLPKLITGHIHEDSRGLVQFINDFDMKPIVRMYAIAPSPGVVRAWQGHKKERKWFHVTRGSLAIKLVPIAAWEAHPKHIQADCFMLRADEYAVLEVPSGYFNGFLTLEPNTELIVFSDMGLEASMQDDFRVTTEAIPWE